MTQCPDEVMWERFLVGALLGEEMESVRRHIGSCEVCTRRATEDEADRTLLAEVQQATLGTPTPGPANLLPSEIAGMRVVRLIGEGSSSIVYEVEQREPTRLIALKLLRHWRAATEHRRAMFSREAEALARLVHPGIAAVYFAGRTPEGQPFLAVERVAGRSLDQYAASVGRDVRTLVLLMAKVAEALQYAHERGVIHRDLKPANIMVDKTDSPKILDFGIARIAADDFRAATLYAEGAGLLGTLPYMAPEQVAGNPSGIDHRCDIYALGATLYEVLTGRPPHALRGLTVSEAGTRICLTDCEPIHQARGDVPITVSAVVTRSLSRDPSARYSSAGEFALALRQSLDANRTPSGQDRASRSGVRLVPFMGLATLVVAALVMWRVWPTTPPVVHGPSPSPVSPPAAGTVRDLRLDGPPPVGAERVRFLSSFYYLVGDAGAAWSAESASLAAEGQGGGGVPRSGRRPESEHERLMRAGLVAEAAGDFARAYDAFTELADQRGRFRFAGKSCAARVLSAWKGCEAAAAAISNLEHAAGADKGSNSAFACDALLVVAGHWQRCGQRDDARRALAAARAAFAELPPDHPRQWFESELARLAQADAGNK